MEIERYNKRNVLWWGNYVNEKRPPLTTNGGRYVAESSEIDIGSTPFVFNLFLNKGQDQKPYKKCNK